MSSPKLNRRTFLTGVGGTVIGLPVLEAMVAPRRVARADESDASLPAPSSSPSRYAVFFAGTSLGTDDIEGDLLVPKTVGPDYELTEALKSLGENGDVRRDVSVVTGLKIPWAEGEQSTPPGGRCSRWHNSTGSPLFSGVRGRDGEDGREPGCEGPTSDQIVRDAIGQSNVFKSLSYRAQVSEYLVGYGIGSRGVMSYRAASGGSVVPVVPEASPLAAFQSLFTTFTPPDPKDAEHKKFLLAQRKSILDLVDRRLGRLLPKLSKADQLRLTRHYDEIRDLEKRIAALPPVVGLECRVLPDPGTDPAIGEDMVYDSNVGIQSFTNKAYSDEALRSRLFCDLIHMAFVCDLTRAASLMVTSFQSNINMTDPIGVTETLHGLGHSFGTLEVSKGVSWNVSPFSYLVSKMKSTPDGDGTLLDHSAMVFLFEGGHGYNPEGSEPKGGTHSSENMACLIAGRAGGLKPGKHVVATDKHPANVLLSAMTAVGVPNGNKLGEVTGTIPELFT